jgi:hypothetical protein
MDDEIGAGVVRDPVILPARPGPDLDGHRIGLDAITDCCPPVAADGVSVMARNLREGLDGYPKATAAPLAALDFRFRAGSRETIFGRLART